jgi:TetR/AcrR family transcriptional regulator, lmrAB and yxaGH operons repressor
VAEAKDAMVRAAIDLLAERGYQGMSFAEVIDVSGAARGSIYHHFPAGKDELVTAAVARAGHRAVRALDDLVGKPAPAVVDAYMDLWRSILVGSGQTAGCSVLAVTVSSANPELIGRAGDVFRAWRERMADVLVAGGMRRRDATGFAALLVAASEGAVVLSRAEGSMAPFEMVSTQLRSTAQQLSRRRS